LIKQVFVRRGVGLNASSGSANDCNDQVEDFTPIPAGPNCVLAVNDFDRENQVRVYPNPSNGTMNIRVNQFVGKLNIQIVDLNGRTIYASTEDNFNIEKSINIYGLQTGVYVLKLTGNNLNYPQKIGKE